MRYDRADLVAVIISAAAAASSLLPAASAVAGPFRAQMGLLGVTVDLGGPAFSLPYYPILAAAVLLAAAALAHIVVRRWWARALSASLATAAAALAVSTVYFTELFISSNLKSASVAVPYGTLYLFVSPRLSIGPLAPLSVASAVAWWSDYIYKEARAIVMTLRECLEVSTRRRYGVSFEELRARRPGMAKAMEDYARFGALCGPVVMEERHKREDQRAS